MAAAKKTAPAKPAAPKKTEAAEKPAKAPKIERAVANGITRPKDDSKTGRIWAIADEISKAQKSPAKRDQVMEKALAEDINEATVATQYQRWRTFYGIEKQPRAVKEKTEKPAKAPKAPAKKTA